MRSLNEEIDVYCEVGEYELIHDFSVVILATCTPVVCEKFGLWVGASYAILDFKLQASSLFSKW